MTSGALTRAADGSPAVRYGLKPCRGDDIAFAPPECILTGKGSLVALTFDRGASYDDRRRDECI